MSRIGKKPIPLPAEVTVEVVEDKIRVSGPKGELERALVPRVEMVIDGRMIHVKPADGSPQARAFQGLFRTLVHNMVVGVSRGFERRLEIIGVGYRAELAERSISLSLGFSKPVDFALPEGIEAKVDRTNITLRGIDKELLGHTAAQLRALRPPEPYKGKGIKYAAETIRRKVGKAGSR